MGEKQTPLIELLGDVPIDACLNVEHDKFSSSHHPVGKLCHEAAAELRRLHEVNAELLEALKNINAACANIPEEIEGYLEPLSDALADARAIEAAVLERMK